jgi:hypothetical protein
VLLAAGTGTRPVTSLGSYTAFQWCHWLARDVT